MPRVAGDQHGYLGHGGVAGRSKGWDRPGLRLAAVMWQTLAATHFVTALSGGVEAGWR